MKDLIPIVVDLLAKHTCVIIPNFGGFIVNEKGAIVNAAGNRFFPPHKELIFNSHLSHNDGLLVHALMQKENISFDEANKIIAEKVKSVKLALDIHKTYSLGDFGFLSLDPVGIIFHAKEIAIENISSFGLHEFYFPVLQPEEKTETHCASRQVRISSSLSRTLMGGIAATIALFLFCQPLKNEGAAYQASLIPATAFSETAIRNVELLAKERALQEEAVKAKTLSYYIVLDEFETEDAASAFINSFELQEGDSLRILPVSKKYLITFSSSSDFEKINDQINDFYSRYIASSAAFVLGVE